VYYEQKEGISKEIYIQDSRKDCKAMMAKHNLPQKTFITWETLASAIIKRDFVFKKYGFVYSNKMQDKIERLYEKWQNI
jgi:predicted phosphoadenosine phosphosulfate sulfurtransferase